MWKVSRLSYSDIKRILSKYSYEKHQHYYILIIEMLIFFMSSKCSDGGGDVHSWKKNVLTYSSNLISMFCLRAIVPLGNGFNFNLEENLERNFNLEENYQLLFVEHLRTIRRAAIRNSKFLIVFELCQFYPINGHWHQ